MMAIKLLRYSVAAILLLLAIGLIAVAILSSELSVPVRVGLAAIGLVSALLGAGCIVNPELAKRLIIGGGIDKT